MIEKGQIMKQWPISDYEKLLAMGDIIMDIVFTAISEWVWHRSEIDLMSKDSDTYTHAAAHIEKLKKQWPI